ncbi:MAG: hypothetical protein WEB88_09080 [Gemmatimonadota bacterium]
MQALTARTRASLKAGTFNRANSRLMVEQICREFLENVRDIRTCLQAIANRAHAGMESSVALMDEDPPSQAALDYIDDIVAAADNSTTAAQLESAIALIESAASATLITAEAELVLSISSVAVSSAYEWEESADEWQSFVDECLDSEGPIVWDDLCPDPFPTIRVGYSIWPPNSTHSITLVAHNGGSWDVAPTFASSSMAVQSAGWDHWRIAKKDIVGAVGGGLVAWAIRAAVPQGVLAGALGYSATEFVDQLLEIIAS